MSDFALLDQLAASANKAISQAEATYRSIMDRVSAPKDGDADALADVMKTLKLTPDDVREDAQATIQLKRAQAAAPSAEALAAELQTVTKAQGELKQAQADWEKRERELKAAADAAYGNYSRLKLAEDALRRAAHVVKQRPRVAALAV
jgi:hypothetical protein